MPPETRKRFAFVLSIASPSRTKIASVAPASRAFWAARMLGRSITLLMSQRPHRSSGRRIAVAPPGGGGGSVARAKENTVGGVPGGGKGVRARRRAAGDLHVDERVGLLEPVLGQQPPGDVREPGHVRRDPRHGEPFAHAVQVLRETVGTPAVEADDLVDRVREEESAVLGRDGGLFAGKESAVEVDDHEEGRR